MSKITSSSSPKKKGNDTVKVVILIVAGVVAFLIIMFSIIGFKNRKKTATGKDFMAGQTQQINSKDEAETKKFESQDNTPDTAKMQSMSPNANPQQNRTFTSEELRKMTKEEREKALKDSLNNQQVAEPNKVFTEEDKKNSQKKLPFDTNLILTKNDFVNYEKHITKMGDRTFLMWLNAKYKGKPYYLTVTGEIYNNLEDSGIVPVKVEYFVDTQNHENVISISVRDDYQSISS